ncbi:kinase-like protein [Fomitiporia mediterranea MF3/22]|uniref:kinase-like protein n=1 Tax=Fomitiporia mediterranea (strain MF3/22) TaxID=694068 RepID=UPI00044082C5|nr:kinase-like protein [Fomitiporia mediterranea MF3/22]EJD03220.1 kinase-like protein [Fomitiporia mediterranea MF3/22]
MLSSSSKMSGTVTSGASSPLDLYEPLEVIGNGSFGIVRKVRRKSDGEVLARKELNFVKMSESDRDKIMVEVNILKDLRHENIVRYTDRFADNDAGILYILMEYCEGGDLSSMINQSARFGRPLPEDTIWSYLLQLLLALHHCHFPGSRTWGDGSLDGNPRQILHRDLKPENVFIGKGGILKLGDFGSSKALDQASFTNTFVGTPWKSYDTKTDIWSLGCLIYELCARRPLFHEARTYDELKALIHKCSIPPLPEGYSQALSDVIKSMLNLNHETRPSTQQLLQHQQIDFARKMADKEKTLKAHESYISELQTRNAHLELQVAMYSSRDREKDS